MKLTLTRKQQEIFDFLIQNQDSFPHPPTLEELCVGIGVKSRGSLHAHIKALIEAKLIEAPERKQRGIRLTDYARQLIGGAENESSLPFVGTIAAGRPIEAVETISYMAIPDELRTQKPCYVLKISGDSMIEAEIYDGDGLAVARSVSCSACRRDRHCPLGTTPAGG